MEGTLIHSMTRNIAALAAFLVLRGPSEAPPPSKEKAPIAVTPPPVPVPAKPEPVPEPVVAPSPIVQVKLTSTPNGARVSEGDKAIGTTPTTIDVVKGAPRRLVLSRRGYLSKTIVANGDATELATRLTARRAPKKNDTKEVGTVKKKKMIQW